MPKGIPGSYDSSPVHGDSGNRHVDIITRDETGHAEAGSKHHVPAENWVERPGDTGGLAGKIASGIGNILKGGKVDE